MGEAKRRKKLDPNWANSSNKLNQKNNRVVSEILSLIINDTQLSLPVFIEEIETEKDASNYDRKLPLIFISNNKQDNGSFNLFVNQIMLGGISELFCDIDNPNFYEIRDEALSVISSTSRDLVSEICGKTEKIPSELFSKNVYSDKKFNYEDWSHLKLAKKLIKNSIESKNKEKLEKYLVVLYALVDALVDHKQKEIISRIFGDAIAQVSYSAFFWHIKTYNPDAVVPEEEDLMDSLISKGIRLMIQDGLVFGKEFSFYMDDNGDRHLTISSDSIYKMKPETLKYINEVTDADL
jgi:hypothetical protein